MGSAPGPSPSPRYRLLPPLALGLPLVVGILLSRVRPEPWSLDAAARRTPAFILLFAAFAVAAWAFVTLAQRHTTWMQGVPSRALVAEGPFRWSRNPLYVAMTLGYLGFALLFGSIWALVLLPVGIAALLWGAILPEERYLSEKFGEDYDLYRQRVRRWL